MDVSVEYWRSVSRIEGSDKGADGVLFFHGESGARVVKSSSTVAQEYFANKLGRVVGLPCPNVVIIEHTTEEWREIKRAICRVLDEADGLRIRALAQLKRPTFLVMEYFPNCHEYDTLHPKLTAEWLDTNTEEGKLRWWALGRVAGFDMLINNRDRMPCCWNNDGNLGNVLLCERSPKGRKALTHGTLLSPSALGVCAIDNVASAILVPRNGGNASARADALQRQQHQFKKVSLLLRGVRTVGSIDAAAGNSSEAEQYAEATRTKLEAYFSYYGMVKVPGDFFKHFSQGLQQFVVDLKAYVSKDTMISLIRELQSSVKVDWEGVWAREVSHIDEEFFLGLLHTFHEANASLSAQGVELVPTPQGMDREACEAIDVLVGLRSMRLGDDTQARSEKKDEASSEEKSKTGSEVPGGGKRVRVGAAASDPPQQRLQAGTSSAFAWPADPWSCLVEAAADTSTTLTASAGLTSDAWGNDSGGGHASEGAGVDHGYLPSLSERKEEETTAPRAAAGKGEQGRATSSRAGGGGGVHHQLAALLDSVRPQALDSRPAVATVVSVQTSGAVMSSVSDVVSRTVSQWCGVSRTAVDLFVFPEDFVEGTGKVSLARNRMLSRVAAIAHEWNTYILLGSMFEGPTMAGRSYKTAVLLGPSTGFQGSVTPLEVQQDGGGLWGYYRKQKPVPGEKIEPGKLPGVIQTGSPVLGTIGVLICFDAEDDSILERLLKQNVSLVVNPCHIQQRSAATYMSWVVAASGVLPRLSWYSRTYGTPIVRVDAAMGDGSGCSAIVTPHATYLHPEPGPSAPAFAVPVITPFAHGTSPPSSSLPPALVAATHGMVPFDESMARTRTRTYDNIGSRYSRRMFKVPEGYRVADVMFVRAHAPSDRATVAAQLDDAMRHSLCESVQRGWRLRSRPPPAATALKKSISVKLEEALLGVLTPVGPDGAARIGAWEPGTGQWLGWAYSADSDGGRHSARWRLLPACFDANATDAAYVAQVAADGAVCMVHAAIAVAISGTLASIKSDFYTRDVHTRVGPMAGPCHTATIALPAGHDASGSLSASVVQWQLRGAEVGVILEGKPSGGNHPWTLEHVFPEPFPVSHMSYSSYNGCIAVLCDNNRPEGNNADGYCAQTLQVITFSQNYEKRRFHDILFPHIRQSKSKE